MTGLLIAAFALLYAATCAAGLTVVRLYRSRLCRFDVAACGVVILLWPLIVVAVGLALVAWALRYLSPVKNQSQRGSPLL